MTKIKIGYEKRSRMQTEWKEYRRKVRNRKGQKNKRRARKRMMTLNSDENEAFGRRGSE